MRNYGAVAIATIIFNVLILVASVYIMIRIRRGSKNQFAFILSWSVFLFCAEYIALVLILFLTQFNTTGAIRTLLLAYQFCYLTLMFQIWLIVQKYYSSSYIFTQKVNVSTQQTISRAANIVLGTLIAAWLALTTLIALRFLIFWQLVAFALFLVLTLTGSFVMALSLYRVRKHLQKLALVSNVQQKDRRMFIFVISLFVYTGLNIVYFSFQCKTLYSESFGDSLKILYYMNLLATSSVQIMILVLCLSVSTVNVHPLRNGFKPDGTPFLQVVSSGDDSSFNQSFDSEQNDSIDSEAALAVLGSRFQSTELYDIDVVIAQFIAKVEDADDDRLLAEDQQETAVPDALKIND